MITNLIFDHFSIGCQFFSKKVYKKAKSIILFLMNLKKRDKRDISILLMDIEDWVRSIFLLFCAVIPLGIIFYIAFHSYEDDVNFLFKASIVGILCFYVFGFILLVLRKIDSHLE